MAKNALDRRVQKTRKLLQDALVGLMLEKGFESVRIQDILDRANVGRSTFYVHFQDKRELLHSCFDGLHSLSEHAMRLSESKKNSRDIHPDFSLKLFQFVEQNPSLFKALLGKQEVPAFLEDFLLTYIHEPLKTGMLRHKRTSVPPEIVTHHFVSVFVGALRWWVSQDMPCTAEQIDKYFKQLVMPSVRGILGN